MFPSTYGAYVTETEQDLVEENLKQFSFELPKKLRDAFVGLVRTRGSNATAVLTNFVNRYIHDPAGTEDILRTQQIHRGALGKKTDGRPTIGLPYTVTAQLRLVHEDIAKALKGLDEVIPKIDEQPSPVPKAESNPADPVGEVLAKSGNIKRGSRKHNPGTGKRREG